MVTDEFGDGGGGGGCVASSQRRRLRVTGGRLLIVPVLSGDGLYESGVGWGEVWWLGEVGKSGSSSC